MNSKWVKKELIWSSFFAGLVCVCILIFSLFPNEIFLFVSLFPVFILILGGFLNTTSIDNKEYFVGVVQFLVGALLFLFLVLLSFSKAVSENTEVLESKPISEGLIVNKVESDSVVPKVSYIVSGDGRTFVVEDVYVKDSKSVGQGVSKIEKVKVTTTKRNLFGKVIEAKESQQNIVR